MSKTLKRKAPSRAKYEQAHPTVSCRVERELYERLQAAKETEGKSFADILKAGLGALEVKIAKEEEVWERGYDQGYKKGCADAQAKYAVYYPCSVCGGMLTVSSEEERQAIKSCMKERGWGHGSCHEKR